MNSMREMMKYYTNSKCYSICNGCPTPDACEFHQVCIDNLQGKPIMKTSSVGYSYNVIKVKKEEGERFNNPKLPSRRYICKICGAKGRRSNKESARRKPPICPFCERKYL